MAQITVTARRPWGWQTITTGDFDTTSDLESRKPTPGNIHDAVQVAERIEALKSDQPVTRWDIISDRERAELDRTPFMMWEGAKQVPGQCRGCGADVDTEGKFARHYVVDDIRYSRLGHCPVARQGSTSSRPEWMR